MQWAAQLEIYGASRFTPHHVGAQPGKSILKEVRRERVWLCPKVAQQKGQRAVLGVARQRCMCISGRYPVRHTHY